ncbi:hypothetical protein [Bartonella capreoli]|nr:hypothetical protein [Bartonella capreoli]
MLWRSCGILREILYHFTEVMVGVWLKLRKKQGLVLTILIMIL